MPDFPSPLKSPTLRDDLPRYPPLLQLLRVTPANVPGPAGTEQVVGSSVPGPVLYVAFTQQMREGSLLPRDREPCLVDDVNNTGLVPGFHLGRLAGSFNGLPVYEVVALGPTGSVIGIPGIPGPAGPGIAFSGARAYTVVDVTIPSPFSSVVIPLELEAYDVGGYHSNVTNNSRLTIPTTGYYHIGALAYILCSVSVPTDTTRMSLTIVRNGDPTEKVVASNVIQITPIGGSINGSIPISCDYYLTSGDYVELYATQNGSTDLLANGISESGGSFSSFGFWIHRIG